jgi:hypothetical protein
MVEEESKSKRGKKGVGSLHTEAYGNRTMVHEQTPGLRPALKQDVSRATIVLSIAVTTGNGFLRYNKTAREVEGS